MAHDLGDVATLSFETGPVPGVLANAGLVTLTIGLPDGTIATPAVTNVPPGRYRVDYLTTQAGRHTVRWVATGVNASSRSDVFDVRPANPEYIVGLADTKTYLNIEGVEDDEELRGFIETATRIVENVVGPVVVRSVAEVHPTGRGLVLNQPPVLTLTSLVPVRGVGASYLPATLDVDSTTGVVRRLDGGWFHGPLRVTYTAGRRIVPATMTMAARVIIAHMWETQRGHWSVQRANAWDRARLTATGGGEMGAPPGVTYMIPRRAMELLEPDRKMPMLA